MKKNFVIFFLLMLGVSCSQTETKNNLDTVFNAEGKNAIVYTTSKDTSFRLTETGKLVFENAVQPKETELFVVVNPLKTFQTFLGIGGAITDASAEVFAKLSEKKQQEFLDAYYGEKGINYSLMRTNIHSCDFSSSSYTYVEEGDKDLKSFSVEHDKKFRIPLIKKAFEKSNGNMTLFASPWSPPAFMKDNKDILHGGKLMPEYYHAWANYFVKFLEAYKAEGIPVWGITVQNEPMATQTWESCIFTAEDERDFLKNNLGPTLQKTGLGDIKIMVWDHNRDLIHHRTSTILEDAEASKYVWGIGFHWYENWTGAQPKYDNIQKVQESYPDKNLFFTEGCNGPFSDKEYQSWSNAERYGQAMINDFNFGTVAWTDWNILLDEKGGPNHVNNFCFAPVHADTRTDSLIYTPAYYYIGHFSKFIRPGAKRVSTTSSRSQLLSTSFLNADGKMVTIVMNSFEMKINFKLFVGSFATELQIPARSIQTLIY
jgi:glucosylceramidase